MRYVSSFEIGLSESMPISSENWTTMSQNSDPRAGRGLGDSLWSGALERRGPEAAQREADERSAIIEA
jgi:hypothetical protein